jgi:hypothetical protein
MAQCPACGTAHEVDVVASVAGDRRPDLKAAILDGSFQTQTCPDCAATFRLPPRFTYMDFARGIWFVAHPVEDESRWSEFEKQAKRLFDVSYRSGGSPAAREIGKSIKPRVVFGWLAAREKLVCDDAGLDDVTVELVKAGILAAVSGAPLGDESELRLDASDAATLHFSWYEAASEQRLSSLLVPRPRYDEIEKDAAWSALRAEFEGVPYTDIGRLIN